MKRPVEKFDFKAFGQAIKAARTARQEARKKMSDERYISPRYLANIENKRQHPSLQIFYELVTLFDVSVYQFFFPNKDAKKPTQRRQLDTLIDGMDDKGLKILIATARGILDYIQNPAKTDGKLLASSFGCPFETADIEFI